MSPHVGSFGARAGTGPTPLARDGLLDGGVPPEAVAETLGALSKEGSRLAAQVREITLVEEAPGDRRWRPKL
jgi:hypothetical protein